MLIENVSPLANNMDELGALRRTQKEYQKCSIMRFTETWLHELMSDSNASLSCFKLYEWAKIGVVCKLNSLKENEILLKERKEEGSEFSFLYISLHPNRCHLKALQRYCLIQANYNPINCSTIIIQSNWSLSRHLDEHRWKAGASAGAEPDSAPGFLENLLNAA